MVGIYATLSERYVIMNIAFIRLNAREQFNQESKAPEIALTGIRFNRTAELMVRDDSFL